MLRKLLDQLHGPFAKGGKLHLLYPVYEVVDTFLYTPGDVSSGASHLRDGIDLKRLMTIVVIALLPCFFMAMHNTGYQANLAIANASVHGTESSLEDHSEQVQEHSALENAGPEKAGPEKAGKVQPLKSWRNDVLSLLGCGHDPDRFVDNFLLGALYFLPIYLVTLMAGGLWEMLFSLVRGHEINEGFLVTSALFPLTLPPTIPLWQVALGISFGVVIGKEIYGGTGKNFLNPALTGRAFLYFAYAGTMTGSTIWTAVDGFSGATPLGALSDAAAETSVTVLTEYSWWDCFFGYIQGSMGETSALACLLGAMVLVALGIGSWRIMVSVTLGALAMATLLWMTSGDSTNAMMHLPPLWHMVIGGFAFGTVFMATDPVSAPMTDTGKWYYGGLIGIMTILIRVINPAYPEGIMLAILFGNVMAPLIDYFVIRSNIKRRRSRYATR